MLWFFFLFSLLPRLWLQRSAVQRPAPPGAAAARPSKNTLPFTNMWPEHTPPKCSSWRRRRSRLRWASWQRKSKHSGWTDARQKKRTFLCGSLTLATSQRSCWKSRSGCHVCRRRDGKHSWRVLVLLQRSRQGSPLLPLLRGGGSARHLRLAESSVWEAAVNGEGDHKLLRRIHEEKLCSEVEALCRWGWRQKESTGRLVEPPWPRISTPGPWCHTPSSRWTEKILR